MAGAIVSEAPHPVFTAWVVTAVTTAEVAAIVETKSTPDPLVLGEQDLSSTGDSPEGRQVLKTHPSPMAPTQPPARHRLCQLKPCSPLGEPE